ncbi:MAG: 2'-5' RNA ligase family protein [Anaerolineales bacterium]|nr:MAG: 2'-5' RNA ligase family protein [Anaerolineales bacterium]
MQLETALLIIPPKPVQVFCFPIRERYDIESFKSNVPAHITLLYPFVPPDQVDTAIEELNRLCAGIPPFDVTIDHYGTFKGAIFLEPSDPDPIVQLHHQLSQIFPEYPVYGGEHGSELHPHLTLARFDDPEEADNIELPPAPSFSFTVDKIHLYLGSAEHDTPFIPRAVIPLGKNI